MPIVRRGLCVVLLSACLGWAQQPSSTAKAGAAQQPGQAAAQSKVQKLLESNVSAEWEAFKKKDKKSYSDLLADDFMAVEDDNQGQRTKAQAVGEIDRSVVNDYRLFAVTVNLLDTSSALVTYEITLLFPPGAAVRFKRVVVAEIWLKRNGQWKQRYYQETHVR